MDKYTNSLSEEIKEIFEAQEKHWVAKWDDQMYYTHRNGLKLCFEEIQKRAEELEERCNNQWLKIQGDAEHISELEAKLAEKDAKIDKLETQSLIDIDHISYYQSQYLEIKDKLDKDKISFAVEQLTKAKEYIKKSLEYMWNNNAKMTFRDRIIIDGIYTKLDKQIEELSHQHEDKGE